MSANPLRPANPATSPLIRGGRYIALGLGFLYGGYHLKRLSSKEVGIQKQENEIRTRRDARLSKENEAAMKEEMNALAKECGVENRM